jgi:hypothetical protein
VRHAHRRVRSLNDERRPRGPVGGKKQGRDKAENQHHAANRTLSWVSLATLSAPTAARSVSAGNNDCKRPAVIAQIVVVDAQHEVTG